MPQALVHTDVTCPYCYSNTPAEIDISGGGFQDYYEDCQICCAPLEVIVQIDMQGEIASIDVRRGNS